MVVTTIYGCFFTMYGGSIKGRLDVGNDQKNSNGNESRQRETMHYSSYANFQRSPWVDMSLINHALRRMPSSKFSAIYLDSYGVNIATGNSNQEEHFIKHILKYYAPFLKFRIVPYLLKTYELTARSFQHRASANNRMGLILGLLAGYKGLGFCVTAGHVVDNVGIIVNISGGIQAECIAKEDIIELTSELKCTADMAFLKVIGQGSNNNFNKMEIYGQIYSKRLWRGGSELMPGPDKEPIEVWMYNQNEEIKKGIIDRYMGWDIDARLYQVFQVRPKFEEAEEHQQFSAKGDSGACVFVPPDEGSNVVYVFGMVVSRYPNTGLTNVVSLKSVIPHMLKNTIASIYPKGPDIRDDDEESIFNAIEFVAPVDVQENLDVGQALSAQTTSEGYACASIGAAQNPESGFGSASG